MQHTGGPLAHGTDKEQMREAVQSVRSKLIRSLRAPERPLLDLGVGFSYELDTSDASLLARPSWFQCVHPSGSRWQSSSQQHCCPAQYSALNREDGLCWCRCGSR